MQARILGLDIGGANLKAATVAREAVSVPFPLWKQPEKLGHTLVELAARFPGIEELAVTMTGELCDCFETKRDGVNAIIAAVRFASAGRRIRVWSTDGVFLDSEAAKRNHLKVAAANWHALATLAGQYRHDRPGILIDIGSTTTDIIPIVHGKPVPRGMVDWERLRFSELIYTGARRTPVCAILGSLVAAEFFATVHDAYLLLGLVPESAEDRDTADSRPATREHAHARMARMLGGDAETVSLAEAASLAHEVLDRQFGMLDHGLRQAEERVRELTGRDPLVPQTHFILAGSGEVLARRYFLQQSSTNPRNAVSMSRIDSLSDRFGGPLSACAPAYAVAVLATEGQHG